MKTQRLSYTIAGISFNIILDNNDSLVSMLDVFNLFSTNKLEKSAFSVKYINNQPKWNREAVFYDSGTNNKGRRSVWYKSHNKYIKEGSPYAELPLSYYSEFNINFTKGSFFVYDRAKFFNEYRLDALQDTVLTMLLPHLYLSNGMLTHASCITKDGKAILFHAPSGTGKSTHSQQWMKAFPDTELLNDDHPIVRVCPDGKVIAYGSPWSGKTPCYKNLSAPVAAFVRINRASENKIHRLSPVEAYASLLPSCTGPVKWNEKIAEAQHHTLSKIVATIPCYQLDCLPDEDAARVCAREVLNI